MAIVLQKPNLEPKTTRSFCQLWVSTVNTRVTLVSVSLIGLIFINKPDDIICHGTLPQIADHDGTLVSFNTKSHKPKQKTRIIYDYKNADVEGLNKFIKEYDFHNTVFCLPAIQQTEMYTKVLQEALANQL